MGWAGLLLKDAGALVDFVTRHSEINEVSGLDPSPDADDILKIADRSRQTGRPWGYIRGNFEPCIIVPAVTEVCLPHAAHSKVKALPPWGHGANPWRPRADTES